VCVGGGGGKEKEKTSVTKFKHFVQPWIPMFDIFNAIDCMCVLFCGSSQWKFSFIWMFMAEWRTIQIAHLCYFWVCLNQIFPEIN
jgi:hypothetical protein